MFFTFYNISQLNSINYSRPVSQHLYVIIGDERFLGCSIVVRKLEVVADNLIFELVVEISCA